MEKLPMPLSLNKDICARLPEESGIAKWFPGLLGFVGRIGKFPGFAVLDKRKRLINIASLERCGRLIVAWLHPHSHFMSPLNFTGVVGGVAGFSGGRLRIQRVRPWKNDKAAVGCSTMAIVSVSRNAL
jgi:hypothetical protein